MKLIHNTVRTLVGMASLGVALSTTPALAQVWQAWADFSTVQGYNNWRYMTYISGDAARYEPMVYGTNYYGWDSWHYETLYGDYIVGPFMHPSGYETARVWESPVAGTVRVTGTAAKWDPYGGDGVYVTIWKNGSPLWDATIAFNDLVGYSYDLAVDVKPGDWLIFRVNRLNDQNDDATIFDPRIVVQSLDGSTGGSWIADVLSAESAYVAGLNLSLFDGQNNNARSGRRVTLSHELKVASNRVSAGETTAAINLLLNVIVRLQGVDPPDWMVDSPEKTALRDDIWVLISLLR